MFSRIALVSVLKLFIFITLFVIVGCEQQRIDVSDINVQPNTIEVGQQASLTINVSGGQDLQFEWSAERGTLSNPNSPSPIYIAPDTPGPDSVTVKVSSGDKTETRSTSLNIVPSAVVVVEDTPTSTPTATVPPDTPTPTPVVPTDTPTPEPPTNTPVPEPTDTPTPSPTPTHTPIPPPTETLPSVRLDAVAIPAGWMTGSQSSGPESFITLGPSQVDCYTGSDCIQITYKPGGGWGGIFWWPPSCGPSGTPDVWERVKNGTCGINVLAAGNLSTVNFLTFWARGNQGGEVIEFKVGAVDLLPKPGRSLGRVTLESTWTPHKIELQGLDLTNATALFAWIAIDDSNQRPETIFYLDDIQFEGMK